MSALYWDNLLAQWVEIASEAVTSDDMDFRFQVWSHDYAFTDQDVRVAFDNFRINFGTLAGCGHPESQLTMLDKLIAYHVDAGGVAPEIGQALQAKVDAALAALARGNNNDAKVAMNELKALVNYVQGQTGKKVTAEAAAAIIDRANAIIATLDG